jgi:hypothetical protein
MVGYFLARKQLSEICHIVAELMYRESIYNRYVSSLLNLK